MSDEDDDIKEKIQISNPKKKNQHHKFHNCDDDRRGAASELCGDGFYGTKFMQTKNEIDVVSKMDMDLTMNMKQNDMKDINIVMDNKNNKAYINLIKERLIGNINETHKQEINSKVSFRQTKEDDLMD